MAPAANPAEGIAQPSDGRMPSIMIRMLNVLLIISMLGLMAGALAACGNKGPLYLPETGDAPSGQDQTKKSSKQKRN